MLLSQIVITGCFAIYGLTDVWPSYDRYIFPKIAPWLIPIVQVNQVLFHNPVADIFLGMNCTTLLDIHFLKADDMWITIVRLKR